MKYLKIPLFDRTANYGEDEVPGIYSEPGEHGYVRESDENSQFIGNDTMALIRVLFEVIEEEPETEQQPFLSTDNELSDVPQEPENPFDDLVRVLESIGGLAKNLKTERHETINIEAIEEGSGSEQL